MTLKIVSGGECEKWVTRTRSKRSSPWRNEFSPGRMLEVVALRAKVFPEAKETIGYGKSEVSRPVTQEKMYKNLLSFDKQYPLHAQGLTN